MTFDLRVDPAIPVSVRAEAPDSPDQVILVGLRDLFVNAHQYSDLVMTIPPAAAGMLRVLYTIAARITGIDKTYTRTQFDDLRAAVATQGRFAEEQVDVYLFRDDLEGRWDLFDPSWPWLQDPRLADQSTLKSANVLDPTRPRNNAPIWWRHTWNHHAPPIPVAEALQWLMAHHWFGSGGTGGTRTVDGVTSQHMSQGPLYGRMSFHPLGHNLFQTIVAGIPSPATAPRSAPDVAPWEATEYPDPLGQPEEATWPAGLLTGQSRHALLLVPDPAATNVQGACLTWGYKKPHPLIADPYTIQDRQRDGTWKPRAADAGRAVWREIDALLADRDDHRRPAILVDTKSLPDSWQSILRVRVYGWDQDRQKAVNRMVITATTPELMPWAFENDPEAADGATALTTTAEELHKLMCTVLRTAYKNLGTGTSSQKSLGEVPWIAPAESAYWQEAESRFWELFGHRQFEQTYRKFLPVALSAIDAATAHVAHHPAIAREVAKAVGQLRRFVAQKNPPMQEGE